MSLSEKRPDLGQFNTSPDEVFFPIWHTCRVVEVDDFDESSAANNGKLKKGKSTGRIRVEMPYVDTNVKWGELRAELEELPWCEPLLPKYINIIPKVGDYVRVTTFDYRNKKQRRIYIGPIIAEQSPTSFELLGDSSFIEANKVESEDEKRYNPSWKSIPKTSIGDWKIYPDLNDIALIGKINTDLILRDRDRYNEVVLRAGKIDFRTLNGGQDSSVKGGVYTLNESISTGGGPAYITINFSLPQTSKIGVSTEESKNLNLNNARSHINLVADNLNLISYKGSNKKGSPDNATYYGGDKIFELQDVEQKKLHPLVYGDVLWDFMKKIQNFVESHIHTGSRGEPDKSLATADLLSWLDKNLGKSTNEDRLKNDFKDCTFLSKGVKTN